MRHLNIFGLRRVGNHAMIEWIAKHFNHTKHYNDCWGWPVPSNNWVTKEYGDSSASFDLTIQSYEDFEPSQEEIEHPDTILLLRDWYNMAASRHVSGRGYINSARQRHASAYNRNVSEVWLKYAEIYHKYPEKFILFNRWTLDEDYRREVSERFNLPGIVEYVSELPKSKIGSGSSFKDSKIDPEEVHLRYKLLASSDKKAYINITSNAEINRHCSTIFGINVESND